MLVRDLGEVRFISRAMMFRSVIDGEMFRTWWNYYLVYTTALAVLDDVKLLLYRKL